MMKYFSNHIYHIKYVCILYYFLSIDIVFSCMLFDDCSTYYSQNLSCARRACHDDFFHFFLTCGSCAQSSFFLNSTAVFRAALIVNHLGTAITSLRRQNKHTLPSLSTPRNRSDNPTMCTKSSTIATGIAVAAHALDIESQQQRSFIAADDDAGKGMGLPCLSSSS